MTCSARRTRSRLLSCVIVVTIVTTVRAIAQSDPQTAALEARIMARLEQRLAEETQDLRRDQEAMRISLQQAIQDLAKSTNDLDRKVLSAIDAGQTAPAVSALVERAEARDELTRKAPKPSLAESRARAEEWKRIGALAFLDNTAKAVEAYEHALGFAPDDPETLDQLAWLYDRLARDADRDRIARRLASSSDVGARARGLLHQADVHLEANDGASARPYVTQALDALRGSGLMRLEAKATNYLVGVQVLSGEFEEARATAQRALTMARAAQATYEEAEALYGQGTIEFAEASTAVFRRKGRLERADRAYEEAQRLMTGLKDEIGAAHVQIRRGHLARLVNDRKAAEQHLRSAIAVFERRGVRSRLGFAYQQLAIVLAKDGDMAEARECFRKGADIAQATGRVGYEALALIEWSMAEYKVGRHDDACRLARQSEVLFGRAGREKERGRAGEVVRRVCR